MARLLIGPVFHTVIADIEILELIIIQANIEDVIG
jgi:hypothetical protein